MTTGIYFFFKSFFSNHSYELDRLIVVLLLFLSVVLPQSVYAHGTVTSPPSRVYNCYQENPENPISPPCIAAVQNYGTQPFYDWMAVLQGNANGDHMAVVPDGNLASGGNPAKYGGLDLVSADWVKTPVDAGAYTVTWTNTAPHATAYYEVYITNENWTPDQPLTWDNLTLLVHTDPSPPESTVDIPVILPSRSGHHVIFSIWQRSDSPEAFYAASDIDFGQGDDGGEDPMSKIVMVSDDLVVTHSAFIQKNLTVDSTAIVGSQIIQSSYPNLTFQFGEDHKFKLSYLDSVQKFIVEEIGHGVALEIKNGEIYFPQYANGVANNLCIDGEGRIIDEAKPHYRFNRYNFSLLEAFQGYHKTELGVHFANGTELLGIEAFLLDNNPSTGGIDNSITVTLLRRSKTSNSSLPEIIFQLTGNNTSDDIYEPFIENVVVNPGTNFVDNISYIYYLEIHYCTDCDFREITILE